MSEARDTETSFDAEFEAARDAELEGSEGQEGGEQEAGGEEEPQAREVDWQKRAIDKEGLAAKERARRRAAEARERELQAEVERLKSRPAQREEPSEDDLAAIINALRDDDDDPITDIGSIKRALKTFMKQQSADGEAEARAAREREGITRLVSAMNEAEADFAEDHPDYKDAVDHFKASRRAEFEDMGYAGRELEQALAQDFLQLAQRSINGGRDPAEVVYNLAKKRGFQSGKAKAEEDLRKIGAAAASRTPAAGRHGETRLTAEAVNKLKGAAYDAAWAKLREQERRAG